MQYHSAGSQVTKKSLDNDSDVISSQVKNARLGDYRLVDTVLIIKQST